jgi:hypothetical protein
MQSDWIQPRNFNEWSRRMVALRPLLLLVMAGILLVSELRFDWMERALGAYLVTTNLERPQSGAIWEKGLRTITAREALEKIVNDRRAVEREARNAASLQEIASGLAPGRGVMVSADHFRRLYLQLSPGIAQEIISPFEILQLFNSPGWHRTYLEKEDRKLRVFLLDADNRVLRQLELLPEALLYMAGENNASPESLEGMPNFENRIYPSGKFFNTLAALPEDVRRSIIPSPERLLGLDGRITRVGISDEAAAGSIEMGFEYLSGTRRRVAVVRGREWAVWRLRAMLENRPQQNRLSRGRRENR